MRKRVISTLLAMATTAGLFAGNVSAVYAEGKSSGDYEYQELEDANYAQTECQFRYCGTAIPFLTVRSTAR